MKELFIKHQTVIFRTLGGLMLVIGFAAHFWTTPKAALTENEIAAANVARIEARIAGGSSTQQSSKKPTESPFLKKYKETQAAQFKFLTILAMIFGVGFLGYSFIKKEEVA